MVSLVVCFAFVIGLVVNPSLSWPLGYGQEPQDDLSEYPMTYGGNSANDLNELGNGDGFSDPEQEFLPLLSLEELRELVEMSRNREGQLAMAKFAPVAEDPTNNGGAGPFKFVKPTPTPTTIQTSPPLVKKHIATISDETPLYLNYAEKEDGGPHRPTGLAGHPQTEEVSKVLLTETKQPQRLFENNKEVDSSSQKGSDADGREDLLNLLAENNNLLAERPEIDFTQRLAFPDLSGNDVQPAKLTAEEEEAEESQEDEAVSPDGKEISENDTEDEAAAAPDTDADLGAEDAVVPTTPAPTDPLVVHVVAAASPQHLGQASDIHLISSPEYAYLLKAVAEKRAQEPSAASSSTSSSSSLTLPLVFACTGSILVACMAAAILHRRNSRKPTLSDQEEPSYGVTGPGPIKPTFLDLSGDRSLAKSAETYHYQHQKRQILSSVENNPSSGGSTATPRSGDHSDYDSDEDEEEGEDYGDYTVYECPGLAGPVDSVEVVNPMFSASNNKENTSEE